MGHFPNIWITNNQISHSELLKPMYKLTDIIVFLFFQVSVFRKPELPSIMEELRYIWCVPGAKYTKQTERGLHRKFTLNWVECSSTQWISVFTVFFCWVFKELWEKRFLKHLTKCKKGPWERRVMTKVPRHFDAEDSAFWLDMNK